MSRVTHTMGPVTHGAVRLTQFARGGGCACKIPPGELEETVARLIPDGRGTQLMVGSNMVTMAPWCGSARTWPLW